MVAVDPHGMAIHDQYIRKTSLLEQLQKIVADGKRESIDHGL